MNNFLPEGYDKIPSNGKYMKLVDGENTFRVLSSAVTGWLYWNTQNRPVRSRERWDETPHDIRIESNGQFKVKHFWVFAVWNYAENAIQILEVTQVQIMTSIKALVDSKHWGDPKNYDIAITRSGSGLDTEYVVQGIPPAPLDPKIAAEYAKLRINLNAMFTGEDPFATSEKPGGNSPPATQPKPDRYATVPPQFRRQPKADDQIMMESDDIPLPPEMPA